MPLNDNLINAVGLEKLKSLKTPFLIYDLEIAISQYEKIRAELQKAIPDTSVVYAYKTNPHIAERLSSLGASFFVTSLNHLNKVKKFVKKGSFVVFNHPAYSADELEKLLSDEKVVVVLESEKQLKLADEISNKLNLHSKVFLRVDTGVKSEATPFKPKYNLGVPIEKSEEVINASRALANVKIVGIHNHFASQNTDLSSWQKNMEKLEKLLNNFPEIDTLNLGGGWPIEYTHRVPSVEEIISVIKPNLENLANRKLKLIVEPGRFIAGPTGKLFTKVLDIRERDIPEVIIDASLLRCFGDRLFYGLTLETKSENLSSKLPTKRYRVIGNSSVSIDDFGQLKLNEVSVGDLLVFHQAGGYFTAIETTFTGVDKPDEYLLDKDLILINPVA